LLLGNLDVLRNAALASLVAKGLVITVALTLTGVLETSGDNGRHGVSAVA